MTKHEALRQYFGYTTFRPGQEYLIDSILSGTDVIGVMPTGAGKSLCFQIPALLFEGVTLVVSPLISLMRDQVMTLCSAGVAAAYLNSSLSSGQFRKAMENMAAGKYKIIYIAPERLLLPDFLQALSSLHVSLLAVDEAHCISQWGKDFRPEYANIPAFAARLPRRPVIAAFTATATDRVKQDIIAQLAFDQYIEFTTSFDRPNLYFGVQQPHSKDAALLRLIGKHTDESGIVYCSTRKSVDSVCAFLQQNGCRAARYHAGLSAAERLASQEAFLFDRVDIIVATNAFGMGIDKPGVRFVVHYNMPLDLESYYQEAGRAGRDGLPSECILLYAKQDVMTGRFLLQKGSEESTADPAVQQAQLQTGYDRLRQMTFYATGTRCLRRELLRYFDEQAPQSCGNCSVCTGAAREDAGDAFLTQGGANHIRKRACTTFDMSAYASYDDDAEEALRHVAASRSVHKKARSLPADPALFELLRELRLTLAKRRGVPAYVVFTDATLLEMCNKRPLTSAALHEISGVGAQKMQDYGDAFLALLVRYAPQETQAQ